MAEKLHYFSIEYEDMIIEFKETQCHYFYRRFLYFDGTITSWRRISWDAFESGLCAYYNI